MDVMIREDSIPCSSVKSNLNLLNITSSTLLMFDLLDMSLIPASAINDNRFKIKLADFRNQL